MLGQTIQVAARTGQDSFGVPTYGSNVAYRGRLVGKRRLVFDATGQQVVSGQTAYLMTAANILPDARVTLSTADVGSTESWAITPPILATGRFPDETGQFHHTTLYLR